MEEKSCLQEEDSVFISEEPANSKYKWYHINTNILPAKLGFAMEAARRVSYNPHLVLFLTSLGLSNIEAGFIVGFRYIGMLIGGPFWGMIADKWHCHKTVIIITCLSSVLMMCSQPFVSIQYGNPDVNKCRIAENVIVDNCTTIGNCSSYNSTSSSTYKPVEQAREKYEDLFIVMFLMYFVVSFLEGSPMAFVDTATIRRCQLSTHRKINYGRQRLWSAPGISFGIVLVNFCIDYFPSANVTCYSGMFIAYAVCTLLFAISVLLLFHGLSFEASAADNQVSVKKQGLRKTLFKTILQRDIIFFYVTTFIGGLVYSAYFIFLFSYLKNLGAPSILLTLSVVTAASSAVFGFFFSKRIIELCGGSWQALTLTFVMSFVRYLGISLIENPWLVLVFQSTQALTFCLFMAAGMGHLKEICPLSLITTMTSMFHSIYFGVGTIVSSTVGGVIYDTFGGKVLFMGNAILSLFWACVVGMYLVCWHRPKQNNKKNNSEIENLNSKIGTEV